MSRIRRTIEMAKASWEVLKADKELLVLPVMSAVATLAVAATFLAPVFVTAGDDGDPGAIGYVLLFIAYVALAFVTIFFNAALVHAANERLEGGDPTLGSALRGAAGHLGAIIGWAAITATVSVILRTLEERFGAVGAVIGGLAGLAWSLVTFLVIPVLVIEGVGVGDSIKRAAELFRRTWGENVTAQIGFGILGFVAALPAVALVALAAATGTGALVVAIAIAVLWAALVAVVLSALSAVFQTALYHYAVSGGVPGTAFTETSVAGAFRPGRRGRAAGPSGFSGSGL